MKRLFKLYCKNSKEDIDLFEKKIDNKQVDPAVYLKHQDISNEDIDNSLVISDNLFYIVTDEKTIAFIKDFNKESKLDTKIIDVTNNAIDLNLNLENANPVFIDSLLDIYKKIYTKDDILDKILESGIDSLSIVDKKILES